MASERAERDQEGRDKWPETSELIVEGVKCASDNFAREGSPFVIARLPGAYPTNLFHSRAPETHREYFEIHPIESPPDPNNPLRACFGRLEFKLSSNGQVLIKHDWSPNVLVAIDLDEITESLAEEIASELLIRVLNPSPKIQRCKVANPMRTKVVLAALIASLVLPIASASADMLCFSWIPIVPNGTTYAEGKTRVGQPCQIGLGLRGADVEEVRILVRPLHGIVGKSDKEANRRYIAYAPATGFVGRDRFEVFVRIRPMDRGSITTRLKVEMNVTP